MLNTTKYCFATLLSAATLFVAQPAQAAVINVNQYDHALTSVSDFLNTGSLALAVNFGDTTNDRTVNGILFEKYSATHTTARYTAAAPANWGIGSGNWSSYFESGPHADAEADALMTAGVYFNGGGTITLHQLTPGAGYRLQLGMALDGFPQTRTYFIAIDGETPLSYTLTDPVPTSRVIEFTPTTTDVVITMSPNPGGPVISSLSLFETQPVPEPATAALLIPAFMGLARLRRRRC